MVYIICFMKTAKVFQNGRSQAIRLPKEFRVKGSQVYLKRVPQGFVVFDQDPWEVCREACQKLSPEYLEALEKRDRLRHQKRDWTGVLP